MCGFTLYIRNVIVFHPILYCQFPFEIRRKTKSIARYAKRENMESLIACCIIFLIFMYELLARYGYLLFSLHTIVFPITHSTHGRTWNRRTIIRGIFHCEYSIQIVRFFKIEMDGFKYWWGIARKCLKLNIKKKITKTDEMWK